MTLDQAKKYQDAILNYKKCVELNPEYRFAYYNAAISYKNLLKLDEAVKWYKNAAANGNANAQFRLAHIFSCSAEACSNPECQKCPIKIDLKESLMWLTKAAEGGLLDAQLALGEYYAEYGPNRNDEKAKEWLKLAANKGSEKGKELLELVSSPGRKSFSKEFKGGAQ